MNVEEALAVLDTVLKQPSLNDIQELIFCQAWSGQTYPEIAEISGYDANYIKDVGCKLWKLLSKAFEEEVTKSNFRSVLKRRTPSRICIGEAWSVGQKPTPIAVGVAEYINVNIQNTKTDLLIANPKLIDTQTTTNKTLCDWGEAGDVSAFYGRIEELNTLKQWIVGDRCRLIAILGMGGMGKTALSVKLAEQIQDEFDYLIWRSLRNAPPVQELLASLIQFLSNQQTELNLPKDVDGKVSRLIECLRSSRCLLVLDNTETILRSGEGTLRDLAGYYREGYEGYGELFRRVGEARHQSCFVVTSREKPKEFSLLAGETLPVRALQLPGLMTPEGREIFRAKGHFYGSESEWSIVVKHYSGNPLALKTVAACVQELFDGSISEFLASLKQRTLVFDDIRDLLERQFARLSDIEKEVMYWLAIERDPVSLLDLQENIVSPALRQKLPEALRSLGKRSLLEQSAANFTQQPVFMEYMIEQIVCQVCKEITTEDVGLLLSHALIKAQAKDYIQESQLRVILEPVADRLYDTFKSKQAIAEQFKRILLKLHSRRASPFPNGSADQGETELSTSVGYGTENIINLLRQLKIDLAGYDFYHQLVYQEA